LRDARRLQELQELLLRLREKSMSDVRPLLRLQERLREKSLRDARRLLRLRERLLDVRRLREWLKRKRDASKLLRLGEQLLLKLLLRLLLMLRKRLLRLREKNNLDMSSPVSGDSAAVVPSSVSVVSRKTHIQISSVLGPLDQLDPRDLCARKEKNAPKELHAPREKNASQDLIASALDPMVVLVLTRTTSNSETASSKTDSINTGSQPLTLSLLRSNTA